VLDFSRKLLWSCRLVAGAVYQRQVPYFSHERIGRLQARRVRQIVRHAYETVPFYRQAMDERGLGPQDFREASDLAKLPLIDKQTIQQDPGRFQSRAIRESDCVALATSKGTRVFWDPASVELALAVAERERAVWLPLAGGGFGCRQLHLLTPNSSTMAVRAFWDRKLRTPAFISRKYYLDPFVSYEEVVQKLQEIRPHAVFCYGSYIEHFFRFVIDSGVSLTLPRLWFYGADTLSPEWRELVEERFGVKVYSGYSTVETSRLGFECERRNGYHLNVDLVAVRLANDAGETVPAGQVGEVVVSNLHNRATVLLNYRMGDLAEMSGQDCPCRRHLPFLRELQGRVSESIHLRDGRRITSAAFLGQFRHVLYSVHRAQAVALEPGRMCWRIVPGRGADPAALRVALLEKCAQVFGPALEATVEFVEDIPLAPSGKYEAVKSSNMRRTTS